MPVRVYSSEEAYQQYKDNPLSNWPERGSPRDRFTGKAAPGFSAGTTLVPGETIVTIGSCFARHVERELAEHGFDIPTRAFTVDPAYWSGEPGTLLNNYVVGAVLPQIRWAFGIGDPFSVDTHCVKMGEKYQDLQIAGNVRPQPREVVEAQRERISAIYRNLAEARVVVLTLGLVEAWWDNKAGMYINMAPPKRAVREDPARFEMRVLDFHDLTTDLYALIDLLKEVGRDDLQVVMTVSPVPLTSTFTDQDVAVANMYSKSLLRTAVDHVRARYDFVSYYPSYESFMLTQKGQAFVRDQVHTNMDLVKFNISRMVAAYLGQGADLSVLDEAEGARKAGNPDEAVQILRDEIAIRPDNGAARGMLGRLLLNAGRYDQAREVVMHEAAETDAEALVVQAKLYLRDEAPEKAVPCARKALKLRAGFKAAMLNLGRGLVGIGETEEAKEVAQQLVGTAQTAEWKANAWMLRGLIAEREGRMDEAVELLEKADGFRSNPAVRTALERVRAAA